MQYLCLIYNDEQEWQKMPKAESEKVMGEFFAFTESVKNSGHCASRGPGSGPSKCARSWSFES